ncbi:endonuclease domain-containing protein [Mycolicibacterium sp. CBM1]
MGVVESPFRGSAALAAGLVSRRSLARDYRPIHRDVYLARDCGVTAVIKAKAAFVWSGGTATVAGLSAAALLGSRWIDDHHPAELVRRNGKAVAGIVIHRDELHRAEICRVAGIPVTTPARTAFDLGRRPGLDKAVVRIDALCNATGLCRADIDRVLVRHRGARGITQLRKVLELVDPGAQSPQETRTRLVLVRAGLPTPATQITVLDECGHFVARVDMGWKQWKVGVEFDGAQHWTDPAQRTRDINRLAELEECGWRIVRVDSQLLRRAPEVVVDRVMAALKAAGCLVEWPLDTRFSLEHVS